MYFQMLDVFGNVFNMCWDMFLGLRTGTGLGAHNSTGQSHMKSHRFHSVLIPFCNAFSGPNPHRLMWTIKRHLYLKLSLKLFSKIKGPDNPTSQLLPILSFKGCSADGEGRKDKGGGERLCVKVCEKIVCMHVRTYVCMYVCVRTNQTKRATQCHQCHATPATQNDGRCEFVPRLARHPVPSVPRMPRNACHATPTTQNDGRRCEFVPRLPRKTTVDVTLCHTYHAKCRDVTDITGDQASPYVKDAGWQSCVWKMVSDKVHACHAKRWWIWDCATPATQKHAKWRGVTGVTGVTGDQASPSAPPSAMSATPATRNDGGCEIVPRLPRKTKVDVRLCHAFHAKCRGVTGVTGDQASPSAPPSAMSATPATQNEGEIVPRLPRKVARRHGRHGRPSQSKRATQCHECHACHAKRWWMWDGATPATRNEGGCEIAPRLPRKVPRRKVIVC